MSCMFRTPLPFSSMLSNIMRMLSTSEASTRPSSLSMNRKNSARLTCIRKHSLLLEMNWVAQNSTCTTGQHTLGLKLHAGVQRFRAVQEMRQGTGPRPIWVTSARRLLCRLRAMRCALCFLVDGDTSLQVHSGVARADNKIRDKGSPPPLATILLLFSET
jgi:hypothetical protein